VGAAVNPIVIDNFLADPARVRQSVLNAGFGTWHPIKGDMGADYYRGLGFYGDHAPIIEAIYKKVGMIGYPNSMVFRVTNETTEKGVIHSDVGAGDTTCFLYLSSHPERYGTGFYRNCRTGLTTMPGLAELAKDAAELERLKTETAASLDSDWEQVEFVRGAFNRIVIFKSHSYHCRFPLHGIGNDESGGRMVWIGHFKDGQIS
jgi:Family of unknown function (DUF6445)